MPSLRNCLLNRCMFFLSLVSIFFVNKQKKAGYENYTSIFFSFLALHVIITISMSESDISFIKSRKGGNLLIYKDFLFKYDKKRKSKTYWKCSTQLCKVRLVLENNSLRKKPADQHTHGTHSAEIEKKKVFWTLTSAAAEQKTVPVPTLYKSFLAEASASDEFLYLPPYITFKSAMYRARHKKQKINTSDDATEQVTSVPVNQITSDPVNQVTSDPVNQVISDRVNQIKPDPEDQVKTDPEDQVTLHSVKQVLLDLADKVTSNLVNQVIKDPAEKVTSNLVNQVIKDPTDKVTSNLVNQVIKDPADKVTSNLVNQVIKDPADKVIPGPEDLNLADQLYHRSSRPVPSFLSWAKTQKRENFLTQKGESKKILEHLEEF